uniref:cyclin-dependent kinase n=1 Tax=Daucus carota subsp. sativus TaxID=79200 RepID=A0A165ZQU2_DAUCS
MAPRNSGRAAELSGLRMENRKRKYSPTVWDRDTNVCKLSSNTGISSRNLLTNTFLSTSSFRVSTGFRESGPPAKSVVDVVSGGCVEDGVLGQYGGRKKSEHEGCAEVHSVRSGRWVDDVEDGEISDSPAHKGMKHITAEMGVSRELTSPLFVEHEREGSEGKSSGLSDKRSDHSTLTDECDMEIDGQQNYGDSTEGHLSSRPEDERGFWETPETGAPLQRSANMLQACRNVDNFEKIRKIGEGTYGVVYKARNKITGEIVALKKVKINNDSEEGFPLTALREINILLSSDHPSIIDLKEVVEGSTSDCCFLVMEYMDHDLKAVMDRKKQPFCQSEVKCLMLQLLQGVKYLHDNWVLHRDLKTSNLLLNSRGELKICDLGMARQYGSPAKPYTQLVVTLWYRAPELLLGAKRYSAAVDMWSVGCIMAELLLNRPLFNGDTEINQIDKIFRMLGTPNETSWPGFSELPKAKVRFVKQPNNLLHKKFPAASFTGTPPLSNAGFDLLNSMLTCDPEKRITADAALNHQWFREFPLPMSKDSFSRVGSVSRHDSKKKAIPELTWAKIITKHLEL